MQAQELRSLTDSVAHAVSGDKMRTNLLYTYLCPDPADRERMLAIATDGHRIAHGSWPTSLGLDFGLLADPKALGRLPKSYKLGGTASVQVTNGTPGIYQLVAGGSVVKAYREGVDITDCDTYRGSFEFPNWRQVMPKERKPTGHATVSDEALETLGRMARITLCCKVSHADKLLVIEQSTGSGFSGKLELPFEGETFETFGMNVGYLADAFLHARAGRTVPVQIDGAEKPVLFGDAFDFELVMPSRI